MLTAISALAERAAVSLIERNALYERFFAGEADRLAGACREMSERFLHGGRLVAFGRGPYATDAQHVSVEFVHPVIVGKRALPALDISALLRPWLDVIVRPQDVVMGFGPPEGDPEIESGLMSAAARGAMTFALPSREPAEIQKSRSWSYCFEAVTRDPFQHQEMIETLYHTLWETVHVFFERQEVGQDAGEAAFLYPFLGGEQPDSAGVAKEVAASIRMKVEDDTRLRAQVANDQAEAIASAVVAIGERLHRGGKLILFGNGGSATDANDWAIDCILPPQGRKPIPAISLSLEPAILTALANDVGNEVIFLRQLIAHGCPGDVAVGISTSGGSRNIVMALEEARKRDLLTVGLLGYDGGEVARRGLADHALVVHSDYIPRIQEVQASIYHVITELLSEGPHVEN
jgi:D-sedoheptulose 7-phosphate isomerase